jgi:hypothetical protein
MSGFDADAMCRRDMVFMYITLVLSQYDNLNRFVYSFEA